MKRTLHCVALPHTQTTSEFLHCAYTQKIVKFCGMMRDQGFEVILYAGDENDADVDELVVCMPKERQEELLSEADWYSSGEIFSVDWDPSLPYWVEFNAKVIANLMVRKQPGDIICLTVGDPHRVILEAFPFPEHLVVETGVGYSGVAAPFRVYESYAWMHTVYGQYMGAMSGDGRVDDAVIPNFFETADFPQGDGQGDYFLYMSRMTHRKGYGIAVETTRQIGAQLLIAGVGGDSVDEPHVTHVGLANSKLRAELLGGARATFVPTLYIEPFGGVAVESMLCGTPVLCTDWGAFTETVSHGEDGFRCRTIDEFVAGALFVDELDRQSIRERAQSRFSIEKIGAEYTRYFQRIVRSHKL